MSSRFLYHLHLFLFIKMNSSYSRKQFYSLRLLSPLNLQMFCIKAVILLFLLPAAAFSQSPTVPSQMEFAGIKLRVTETARAEIQKDVDALTRSPKYFNIKVERAKTYFPFIEAVFREQGLHDDFKYLVLQESALIPDAVSSSDAVGFWQFKDFTALEVGLRVDNHIDERMNIVSSSRGAARYMKKNNLYFDNWLHTLQAYQMGPGGAMRVLGEGKKGAKSMMITKDTYWYVKKFLAHKVAFESAVDGEGKTKLMEYPDGKNKSLKEIAEETGISLEQIENYNKWLKKGKIPEDKHYAVVLPVTEVEQIKVASLQTDISPESSRELEYKFPRNDKFPQIEDPEAAKNGRIVEINRIPGTIAREGDNVAGLARKGDVDLDKFLKYNEINIKDKIIAGQVYYFKRKRSKAQTHYYVAQSGETWWSVAQKFGVKLKKLKRKNRIRGDDEPLKAGRIVWLRFIRPERIEVEYRNVEPNPVNEKLIAKKANQAEPISKLSAENTNDISAPAGREDASGEKNVEVSLVNSEKNLAVDEEIDVEYFSEQDEKGAEQQLKIHVVQPGESLYAISKKYEVTVKDLVDWNQLSIADGISVDQQLIVSGKRLSEDVESHRKESAYIYHEVVQGETLYNIARTYSVSVEELMSWNDKEDFKLSVGEKIRIKSNLE